MAVKLPNLKPGYIYCIREQDYLDLSWGRYVKLGLTERTVAERIREHQTGNPRKESSEYDLFVPLMTYTETYLHHHFASERIAGEWFDMDTAKVQADVASLLETLRDEQNEILPYLMRWEELKATPSNGTERDPNQDELDLHEEYKTADEALKLAEANHEINDAKIRALIADNDGIECVVTLIRKTYKDTCNSSTLKTLLTDDEKEQCITAGESKLSGQLNITPGRTLEELNQQLAEDLQEAKDEITTTPTVDNLDNTPLALTDEIKELHINWLGTMRAAKEAEWRTVKAAAKLIDALGEDERIRGLILWKRAMSTPTASFKSAKAKELFPDKYELALEPKADTVSVDIHKGRTYLPP